MPHILHVILLYAILIRCLDSNRFMKPNFPDFCIMSNECKQACNCEVYPNCSLLSMNDTVRKTILFYHNQIRDMQTRIEPQPSGMTMLHYDMQLEEISKCWAAQCDNEYSVCFKTQKFAETSQSVGGLILEGEESPNVFLWLQMMSYWLGQAEVVSAEDIHGLPVDQRFESMHNFAQLMSDNVLSVGCAWSILTTDNWLIFVCTYGPRGPERGEAIYSTGYPCSHCPQNYNCDYSKPFERLCKPNLEGLKPPPVIKEELPEPPLPPISNYIPEHQNPSLNEDFNGPPLPDPPTLPDSQIYGTSAPQGYQPVVPPLPSSPNNSPFFPNFGTHTFPYFTPLQYIPTVPQYIPQPPPLPRSSAPLTVNSDGKFVPHQISPPFQPNQVPLQSPIPPPPNEENIQDYSHYQPRQPPPDSLVKPQPVPAEPSYPYVRSQYNPDFGNPKFSPPFVDLSLPQEYPLVDDNPPGYAEHTQRSLYPEMSAYLKYPKIAKPSTPSPPQLPPQFDVYIDQTNAQPLLPPTSYFPPQPPSLPRVQYPVIPPLPPSPSYPIPIRPIAPQTPEDSRFYMTARSENSLPVNDKPSLFPPPKIPGQSSFNEKDIGKKEERIEGRVKHGRSNGSLPADSFVVLLFSNIFLVKIL